MNKSYNDAIQLQNLHFKIERISSCQLFFTVKNNQAFTS